MFESAELGHEIDKERYEAEVPKLRSELLAAQYELVKSQTFSVVILIADGGGKGDTLNTPCPPRSATRHGRGDRGRVVGRSIEPIATPARSTVAHRSTVVTWAPQDVGTATADRFRARVRRASCFR
jgi:hypothetical protein